MEEARKQCLKKRDYIWLFIAMFNRNILLKILKTTPIINDKYRDIEEYDIKNKFNNLPNDLQSALIPILEIVDFTLIYKYYHNINNDLQQTEKNKNLVEKGGFVSSSNINEFAGKHQNLIHFVLSNKIMLERFTEFKGIKKAFVKISLMRQVLKDKVVFNKIELYSCIKYYQYAELKEIFQDYYDNNNSSNIGTFFISDENQKWLVDSVLENNLQPFLYDRDIFSNTEMYIKNTLFILSLSKLQDENILAIIGKIKNILNKGPGSFNLLQSINSFLGIQYLLYETKINGTLLIDVIETIINKLIYNNLTGYEYMAISRNQLANFYSYALESGACFKNIHLIEKLISHVDKYEINEKIDLFQSLLLNINEICNKEIKDITANFAKNISIDDKVEEYKKVIFKLNLVIYKFKELDDILINDIEKYLNKYIGTNGFSSDLPIIKRQLDYLIQKQSKDELSKYSKLITDLYSNYKKISDFSIF